MAGSNKLRIAVSGGGLAGAALANVLFRQEHLEVQLFESAPQFSERGQAIGVAINAQRALAHLVPDAEDLLTRAGAVPMHSTRLLMVSARILLSFWSKSDRDDKGEFALLLLGTSTDESIAQGNGPAAGTKVIDLAEEHPGRIVHRAAFLRELLAPLPRENMHTNKKLIAVDYTQDYNLLLRFEDGSTVEVDALVGADGLFGFVRAHVLGADHEAVQPIAAGWAGVHNLVPFSKACDKLGADLFKKDRQYGWIGNEGLMMPATLLLDQDDPATFAQWEHRDAPTYAKNRVCIMGDSAHAMTPWQGSGGATALEDAVVLGALFAQIRSPDQVKDALRAYDAVRRPRTQSMAASSRLTGRIMTGLVEEVGTDPVKMHDALKNRWNFIYDFDLGEHVEEAVAMLWNH
ncbi:MAG: hypothetical protein M1821_004259 [Bathelium mastoideum]|nr:MAG: hypothetical protein M1821_004259 [Bathelium mastoideum]